MRFGKLASACIAVAVFMIFILPPVAEAQDGAATYKAKCAGCHGADGGGKAGPALKGIGLSADQIADFLTKGDGAKKSPHKKPMNGLSPDDAKAVAGYIKTLK